MTSFSINPITETQYIENNGINPFFTQGSTTPTNIGFPQGTIYYDSTNSVLYVFADNQWRSSSSLPSGQTAGALLTATGTDTNSITWITPPTSTTGIGAFLQYNALGSVPRWNVSAYTEYIWTNVVMSASGGPLPQSNTPAIFEPNTLYALGVFEVFPQQDLPAGSQITELKIELSIAPTQYVYVATFQPSTLQNTMSSSTHLIPLLGIPEIAVSFSLFADNGQDIPINASLKVLCI
jgi:hypothetical protein